jgi:hypothetical protein
MTETKSVTQGELEKHVDEKDCWLAIHGKVYDVSSYLVDHPGGLDVMMEYAGASAYVVMESFSFGATVCPLRTSSGRKARPFSLPRFSFESGLYSCFHAVIMPLSCTMSDGECTRRNHSICDAFFTCVFQKLEPVNSSCLLLVTI